MADNIAIPRDLTNLYTLDTSKDKPELTPHTDILRTYLISLEKRIANLEKRVKDLEV